jgi:hypothetical protein
VILYSPWSAVCDEKFCGRLNYNKIYAPHLGHETADSTGREFNSYLKLLH